MEVILAPFHKYFEGVGFFAGDLMNLLRRSRLRCHLISISIRDRVSSRRLTLRFTSVMIASAKGIKAFGHRDLGPLSVQLDQLNHTPLHSM